MYSDSVYNTWYTKHIKLNIFLILGSTDASSFKSKSIVISNLKYLSNENVKAKYI